MKREFHSLRLSEWRLLLAGRPPPPSADSAAVDVALGGAFLRLAVPGRLADLTRCFF